VETCYYPREQKKVAHAAFFLPTVKQSLWRFDRAALCWPYSWNGISTPVKLPPNTLVEMEWWYVLNRPRAYDYE